MSEPAGRWRGFPLSAEQEAFRADLCAFLTRELTDEVRAAEFDPTQYLGWTPSFRREFRRRTGAAGYLAAGWPVEYGGSGRDAVHQVLLVDELEYHAAPVIEPATTYAPYVLITHGTEEQKRDLLPRLARGELSIFLGYSEPEAGSDLASLSATATPDADGYVITGQKSYSSWGDIADYGLVAARLPGTSRHQGVCIFVVDMTLPGISVSTHTTVGDFEHPSVYFDHVRVRAAMRLGEEGGAWSVLLSAIDFERTSLASPGLLAQQSDRLAAIAACRDDPLAWDRIVSVLIDQESARVLAYDIGERRASGRPLEQYLASLAILLKRQSGRLADDTAMQLLEAAAPLTDDAVVPTFGGELEHGYRDRLYFRFAAGGFDITRNVLATRALGLPR